MIVMCNDVWRKPKLNSFGFIRSDVPVMPHLSPIPA
jgi:hypothetical protein